MLRHIILCRNVGMKDFLRDDKKVTIFKIDKTDNISLSSRYLPGIYSISTRRKKRSEINI